MINEITASIKDPNIFWEIVNRTRQSAKELSSYMINGNGTKVYTDEEKEIV